MDAARHTEGLKLHRAPSQTAPQAAPDPARQVAAGVARSTAVLGTFPGGSSHRPVLLLQRLGGNACVSRMFTAPVTPFVQRLNLPEALPDDITRVLTDSQPPNNTDAKMTAAILGKISKGKASERVTARTDPRIIQRMTAALSRANTLKIMRALAATLSQRMPLATGTAFATPTTVKLVNTEIVASPAAERRQVLTEPSALNGIQTALSRPDSLKAMVALGASLREILDAAMRGAGAEGAAMVNATAAAPAAQRKEVLEDGALMTLMRDRLDRAPRLKILVSLGAPAVDLLNATVDGPKAADPVAALKTATTIPPAGRDLVRADRELLARLQAALTPVQQRDVLVALGASLADILGLVLGTPGGDEAAVAKLIGGADGTKRQAVLDDAALLARIKTTFAVAPYWRLRLLLAFGTPAKVAASSPQIPALSNGAAYQAAAHIAAGEQADAVKAVVDSLVSRHNIDPATYKVISYDSSVAADAQATFAGFAQDATTKKFAPTDKATIKVGTKGFANASVLTASIMRECARAIREARPATMDPTSGDAVKIGAVETVLSEIEHRAESGIRRYGARMAELGARLDAAYTALDPKVQKKFEVRHDRAKAAVAAVPAGAAPVATQSLTALISAELAKAPPGGAAIKTAVAAASAGDKKPVLENHGLVNRVVAVMSRPDALTVLTQLGAPLSQRVEYLRQVGAPQAEIVAAISGATAADRRSVSQNRALADSVVTNLGDGQVAGVMSNLGGSLSDELDRALRAATPLASVTAAIGAASADKRQGVERNLALLNRIHAAVGNYDFWRVQLLLRFGNPGAFPSGATKLVAAFAGAPAIAAIRLAFRKLTDAELTSAKTLPGIREVLAALLPTAADLTIALRMLDLGMLDEQLGMGGAVNETLQVLNPATGLYVPTPFAAASAWDLEYKRDRIEATVRINVTAAGGDVKARKYLDNAKKVWEANIERAWNRKYKATNAVHNLPLVFNPNFTSSSPHHNVTAHSGIPVWPGLNATNWFVHDPTTPVGNQVYVDNAAIHEFGHMIGNPDEYDLSQAHYTATVGTNPATDPNAACTPDAAGTLRCTNTNSVMGGLVAGNIPGPIQMRHVNFMLTWINAHLNPGEPAFTLAPA